MQWSLFAAELDLLAAADRGRARDERSASM